MDKWKDFGYRWRCLHVEIPSLRPGVGFTLEQEWHEMILFASLTTFSLASRQIRQPVVLEAERLPWLVCCLCVIHDPFVEKHQDTR
jgi:hypothetical protein